MADMAMAMHQFCEAAGAVIVRRHARGRMKSETDACTMPQPLHRLFIEMSEQHSRAADI